MADKKKGGNQGGQGSQNRGGEERVQPDERQRDSTQSGRQGGGQHAGQKTQGGSQDKRQEGGEKQQGGKHGEQRTQGNPSRSERRK